MIFGEHRVEIIPDTEFRLDGGAMFGVVPRVLWERVLSPDEMNRVSMNMNCVFIDTGKDKILIETGIGEKWSEKDSNIYGIFRKRSFADSLYHIAGCSPEEITIVINTHLHFDHCGGNTSLNTTPDKETGHELLPQFPNARYLISKSEFEHAENPHERDRANYIPENWRPIKESGQLELMPNEFEVIPGLRFETNAGHNKSMLTWRLDSGEQTMYGFADLIPTTHHISLPWIMGYDLFPTETLEFKRRILPQAVKENWLCVFYHDFDSPISNIVKIEGKLKTKKYVG